MDPNLVLTWIYFFKQLLCSFTRTWNTATICKLGPGHLEMADSLTWNLPSLRHLAIKTQTLMCFELQFFKNIFSPIDSLFQISQISEVLPIIQPTEVHKSVTWTRLFLVTYSSSLLPRPEAGLRWHVSFCSRRVLGQLEVGGLQARHSNDSFQTSICQLEWPHLNEAAMPLATQNP